MHSAFVAALGSEIDRSRTNSIRRGLRPGELLRYDHCTDERPSEEHSSPLLWSDVKLIYCGSYVCARTQCTGEADHGAGPSTP